MTEFEEERKRDLMDNATQDMDILYYDVCRRYLKDIGPFGGDTVANQALVDHMSRVFHEEGGEVGCSDLLRRTADGMVTDIKNGDLHIYDMPDHYEEACTQIKLGRLTTRQEVEAFLDEHAECEEESVDITESLLGADITINLDEPMCRTMTAILIKPEAPVKVTAITGNVIGMVIEATNCDDLSLTLADCKILTENR